MVGREREQHELLRLLEQSESQFCAVYGRRRVGKTFLIKETFRDKFAFYHTGLANADKSDQLQEFRHTLQSYGYKSRMPKSWYEAFHQLEDYLSGCEEDKKVVFIDELPWMDTPGSKFVSALEHFWNGWANLRNDIVLIVCGSATSWIVSNIFQNHGGLYGRLTRQIYLRQFTLYECEQYLRSMDITLSRKEIMEAYMIMGGVPYYWSYMRRGESLAQNINNIFFGQNAPLANEFDALYKSLFHRPEGYIAIVAALTKKKAGMTREELLRESHLNDNAVFVRQLQELEQCDFIRTYQKLGQKKKDTVYQLMDNFTLFHYRYMAANSSRDEHFWSANQSTPQHNTWAGLAFERICFQHIRQIKQRLGISGIRSSEYSFTYRPKEEEDPGWAVQIDMLIDRADGVIDMCEMKYAKDDYLVTSEEETKVRKRLSCLAARGKTRSAIHTVLMTPYGVVNNAYSHIFEQVIRADDLFYP